MSREFSEKCESFYAAVGATFDKYEEEENEKLEPQVALAVVSKLYASIGYNTEIDKKELLSYMADIIDDVYSDNEETGNAG